MLPVREARVIVLSVVGLFAGEGARAQEKPPEFPSAVEVVTVDVVVKDKKGNPVPGLGRAEFTLLEEGRVQAIASFDEVSGSISIDAASTEDDVVSEGPAPSGPAPAASRLRRTFVVVFDQVHLTSLQASRCRRALETFLKGVLREGDRVRLVAVDGWEFEGPAEEAVDELPRLEGKRVPEQGPEALTDYEAMRIDRFDDGPLMLRVIERIVILTSGRRPPDREGERIRNNTPQEMEMHFRIDESYVKILAKGVYNEVVRRNETTLGALESVLEKLTFERGRKAVILVSPGFIQDPNLDGFRRVIEASNRANAAIYFLDARGLEGIPGESPEHGTMLPSIDQGLALTSQSLQSQGSEILAADTGGLTVKNRNDLTTGFRQIAAETRSYYLLGYTPAPAKVDGEFRRIEVKVRRQGVQVRARKGYYASLAGAAHASRSASEKAGPALDPHGEIPLRATSYVFGDAGAGKLRTLVATEADIRGLALESRDGLLRGSLDLVIVVTPTGGGPADRFVQQVDVSLTPERRKSLETRGLPLARALDLAPGEYEARVALSDRKSGRVGAVSHRFEVPAGAFRVSTPILSDTMEPGPDAARDVPTLGARRRFPERGTLYFQYEVYGARADPSTGDPAVLSSWTIRDRTGALWAGAEPARLETTGHRVPSRLGQVDLTFPPGEYTLVLDARDQIGARSVEVREAFTIEAAKP
jgi:VWFA-related protein